MGGWWGKSLALADGNDKILGWSKAAGGRGRRVSRSRRRREEKRDRSGKCSWGSGDARTMLRLWPHNSHMMLRWCLDCNHTFLIWCLDDNSVGQILQKVKLKFASKFGVNLGLKTSTSTSKLPPNITKHHNFTLFYVMPTWTECFRPFPPFYLNFLFQHFFLPSSKGIVPRGTYWLRRKHFERIWREDGMLAEVLGALTGLQVIDRRKYWVSAEAESGNW